MAETRRFTIPSFVLDLGREPGAVGILVAGSLAIFAAGLDPKVFSSGMPTSQEALRQRPQLESWFLLSVLVQVAFVLVGGALGDLMSRKRILLAGLLGLALADLGAAVAGSGDLLIACRLVASASTGLIIPVALAVVALTYTGAVRATALGVAYAAMGAATALTPALLMAVTPTIGRWPSFLLATAGALLALRLVWKRVPDHGRSGLRPPDVAGHAVWAFGLLAITGGVVGFGKDSESIIRQTLIVGGLILIGVFLVWQRRRARVSPDAAIDVRAVTVALFAGVVIAFAQTAPSLQAPLYFQIGQQYSSLLATLAIAPFVLALLVSGPIAGLLLQRYSPRSLIAGGLFAIGVGDLVFAQAGTNTPYLFFIVPFMAIGAGFVIGTCVRTAVIFASVPRRLPATAAALNQSSLMVGGTIGVAMVTAYVASQAMEAFTRGVASLPTSQAQSAVAGFSDFLKAIGTSSFGEMVTDLSAGITAQYGAAYASGVTNVLASVGVLAIVCSVIAWFAMGPRDSLVSVWEHRDERAPAPTGSLADA
jgi:MFS family permease